MTPTLLFAKAVQAHVSAHTLLDLGDPDGAVNRAYYAMFDAARAALLAAQLPDLSTARTHSGLIAAFGKHLVKTGLVSTELGRSLNRAHEIRLMADYNGPAIEPTTAADLVRQAGVFVAAMQAAFPT